MSRRSTLWGKTILCLLILTLTTQANTEDQTKKGHNVSDTSSLMMTYQSMSTEQLQKEVEKRSQNGSLSFALGQELIKRWTKS